jgi:hypothetical protein
MVMPTLLRKLYDAITTNGGSSYFNTLSSPAGLRIGLNITNLVVTDVASPVPLVALVGRNSISIENRGADSIFWGNSDVEASGIKEGGEIPPLSSFATDVTDAIVLYAIAPAGKTVNAKITEFA